MNNKRKDNKRKDNKGRVLKPGESQRKNKSYQYRYKDLRGNLKTVYAPTLDLLRKKEKEIHTQLLFGIDYGNGEISVIDLTERYTALKVGVRHNTKVGYNFVLNLLKKEDFGYLKISQIKVSDVKSWFAKMQQQDGRSYSTISSVRGVLKPAFQMACDEDAIRKNPFNFKLTDVVVNDTVQREALSEEEIATWMDYVAHDKTYSKYYDEFVVLLETGMRVSEFCGLTRKDLDFEKRRIRVDHQLLRERSGRYHVEKTKTRSGCRYLPMNDNVYCALRKILARRPKVKTEPMIDGYTGFLLLDKNSNPKVSLHIEHELSWAQTKYDKLHPDHPLPHITPHVLRHTYCTNCVKRGMDVKALQYLMGHSDVSTTLDTYTHAGYDFAAGQAKKIDEAWQKNGFYDIDDPAGTDKNVRSHA